MANAVVKPAIRLNLQRPLAHQLTTLRLRRHWARALAMPWMRATSPFQRPASAAIRSQGILVGQAKAAATGC
jgi:hypothetical protein